MPVSDPRDAEIAALKAEVERLREYERLHGARSNEIGALRAEVARIRVEADEAIVANLVTRKRNERLTRALAAGPAALRALRSDDYSPGYVAGVVERAQEAAMKDDAKEGGG